MLKVVKINKDRGYGNGLWEVLSTSSRPDEYRLKSLDTGKQMSLYIVHCFEDMETRRKSFSLQKERANKIGR
jgi:hypothetical protein